MKNLMLILFSLSLLSCFGQYIYHPASSKTIVKIKSGQTYQYFDSGGPNENYAYNTNSLITIYPETKGEFVSVKCDQVDLASDTRMYIFDGNHAGAAIIGYFNGKTGIQGKTFTASVANSSGAISIRFVSLKRRTALSGWKFIVSTSNTAGARPRKTTSDCFGAIKVCSDSALTTRARGPGIQEMPGPGFWSGTVNDGKNGEIQSNWYKFEVKTPGTIEFLITPKTHTDFDWALWGPYPAHECPAWTTDMYYRASACRGDAHNGLTGIKKGETLTVGRFDTGECFVAELNVKKGEHYVMMIDDWSGKSAEFELRWRFTNGASLECKKDKLPSSKPSSNEVIEEIIEIDPPKDPIVEIDTIAEVTEIDTLEEVVEINSTQDSLEFDVEEIDTSTSSFPEIEISEIPKLEAELSRDEQWVTVKYPGAFEWKIENMNSETVRTGHSVDTQDVDVSNLPPGQYRVSLIYKQIKQYTTFIKH